MTRCIQVARVGLARLAGASMAAVASQVGEPAELQARLGVGGMLEDNP